MKLKILLAGAVLAVVAFLLVPFEGETVSEQLDDTKTGAALAEVVMPAALSENATVGKRAYTAKCASCHGANAEGQNGVAPPLIHKIYEPSHHGDEAFQRAAAVGVQAHHWPFGDMPPVEGVTRADVKMIIAYIREVQRANGIN